MTKNYCFHLLASLKSLQILGLLYTNSSAKEDKMLTGFKSQTSQKKATEDQNKADKHYSFMRQLLTEALYETITTGDQRVYINDYPYRVEFKFPGSFTARDIKVLLEANKVLPLESKVLADEILVHSFKLLPDQILEVLYRPISRPRM